MKKQAELGLNLSTRRTRKAVFLDEMELVVPWRELIALIAAASPVASTGRPPFAHETMLRIHFLQQWFGLSDLAIAPLLRADVLKVPHHGSSTSTTDALLNAVAPTIALMGVGERNPWHFPHPDVVARLASHHVDLWRTDEDGLITVDLDEHGVTVDAYAR